MTKTQKYTTWEALPDILTASQISQFLGISRRRVYELFQMNPVYGGIPNLQVGSSKRVEKADFREWLDRRKADQKHSYSD